MLIVFGLVLVDVTILIIYTVLEGVITRFSAGSEPNEERERAVHGVKYIFNLSDMWTSID